MAPMANRTGTAAGGHRHSKQCRHIDVALARDVGVVTGQEGVSSHVVAGLAVVAGGGGQASWRRQQRRLLARVGRPQQAKAAEPGRVSSAAGATRALPIRRKSARTPI